MLNILKMKVLKMFLLSYVKQCSLIFFKCYAIFITQILIQLEN